MEDEIKRSQYRSLRRQLVQIRTKLSNLNSYNNNLLGKMSNALLIDNKIINQNEIEKLNTKTRYMVNEITNVISSIDNKL